MIMQRISKAEDSMEKDKLKKRNIVPMLLKMKRERPDMTENEMHYFALGYKVAQSG